MNLLKKYATLLECLARPRFEDYRIVQMICMTESDKLLFVHAIEEWERTGLIRWYDLYPMVVKVALIKEGYLDHDRH